MASEQCTREVVSLYNSIKNRYYFDSLLMFTEKAGMFLIIISKYLLQFTDVSETIIGNERCI